MSQQETISPSFPDGLVASVAYVRGQRFRDVPLDEIKTHTIAQEHLLWIGLRNPNATLLERVLKDLGIRPKAREEMLEVHRRPKVIDFGHCVLVVGITVEVGQGRPSFGETQIVIGDGYLVTVRRGATANHSGLRERLESAPDLLRRGSDYVASELLDLLVDRYVEAAAKLEAVVEGAEQKLMIRGAKDADIRTIYRQRRDLLRVHTVISPLTEICRRLATLEMANIDAEARPYFSIVADRVKRVDELVSGLRETLAFAFEASLMMAQTQQNDIMRRLAAWAAILAVPTAVAGIYGMNFEFMPGLQTPWGFPLTLAGIGAVCGCLYWRFRKAGWL
ncbi:magnesium and cobalt transport protein CorA [Bordetella sp. 15P40C-2]|uniref:magnesium and cobalt transport protein CorA n=1 Tax=Bordetella sp. 15P40C-2 TaxID=2572246 RepID=UPI0013280DF4|nr:magnesium and cobalt transport protein CorA [Bordetella sp. 15P40C-2]MVW70556.1 magnesium and cobalt transport protein CorA [Bordetella sp. 15P40C-2]